MRPRRGPVPHGRIRPPALSGTGAQPARVRAIVRHRMVGDIMLRFAAGLLLGVVIGLYLSSFPAVTEGLAEIGQILSISALATLL